MPQFSRAGLNGLWILIAIVGPGCSLCRAESQPLQKFENAQWIDDELNDGDSFRVKAGDDEFRVRLYFVDCPETRGTGNKYPARVREQMDYFGLKQGEAQASAFFDFAQQSKELVKQELSAPFTIWRGPYDKENERYYSFVYVADSSDRDLAMLLVEKGMARVHGVRRKTPAGTTAEDYLDLLREREASAMLSRSGLWKDTDADEFLKLRKQLRDESAANKTVRDAAKDEAAGEESRKPRVPVSPNKASREELMDIPGIGAKTADEIIRVRRERPIDSLDDLLKRVRIPAPNVDTLKDALTFKGE